MKTKKKNLSLGLIILGLQLFQFQFIKACTCAPIEYFCGNTYESQYIVRATIVDSLEIKEEYLQQLKIKILDNLSLEIPNDTTFIESGGGADCGESLDKFEVGDTLIFALNESYYTQGFYFLRGVCGPHFLRYSEGRVSGNITPDSTSMSYEKFVSDLLACVDFNVNTNQVTASQYNIQFAPIPVRNQLRISLEDSQILRYEVYHINGQLISSQYGLNEKQLLLNWENWEAGLYVIRLVLDKGVFSKVIPKS